MNRPAKSMIAGSSISGPIAPELVISHQGKAAEIASVKGDKLLESDVGYQTTLLRDIV